MQKKSIEKENTYIHSELIDEKEKNKVNKVK